MTIRFQKLNLKHGDIMAIDKEHGLIWFGGEVQHYFRAEDGDKKEPDNKLIIWDKGQSGIGLFGLCALVSALTGFGLEQVDSNEKLERYRLVQSS